MHLLQLSLPCAACSSSPEDTLNQAQGHDTHNMISQWPTHMHTYTLY